MSGTSSPEVAAAKADLGNRVRWHGGDAEAVDEARRALKFANMADYLARQMDGTPALTGEQVDRLVGVLRREDA
jgi:hypothetical protein